MYKINRLRLLQTLFVLFAFSSCSFAQSAIDNNRTFNLHVNFQPTQGEVVAQNLGIEEASVFDAPATIVHPDGKSVVLYVWYDNEFGYTKQVLRLAKYVSKVRRLHYY